MNEFLKINSGVCDKRTKAVTLFIDKDMKNDTLFQAQIRKMPHYSKEKQN